MSKANIALNAVYNAMWQGENNLTKAAAEHMQAFKSQMREKVGVDEITIDEPYLPLTILHSILRHLLALEKIEGRILSAGFETGIGDDEDEDDDDDDEDDENEQEDSPWQDRIDREINRTELELKQQLDSMRQQAFGIEKYVWVGGDCPLCAPYNGEIFTWGEGDEPGGVHPNCNCSGEPTLDDAGDPKNPDITPEQLASLIAMLAALTPQGRAVRIGATVIRNAAGKLVNGSLEAGRAAGRRLRELLDDQSSGTRPAEKPSTLKPRMNDTRTWPKPPRDGKFREGLPSRTKPQNRGEKSLFDENGGEWRYDPGDKYHNPHWNYKPPGKAQEWQNILIDDIPHLKNR